MSVLCVPSLDEEPWPTLGPLLCQWLETFGTYGPGDLAGEPYRVDPMFRAWLYKAYEVYPRQHRLAGRRRFSSCVISERKGLAKTEKLALVALLESHPDAPVRCCGWTKSPKGDGWVPDARGIPRDAYLPLVAYTKDQTEELAYGALKAIIRDGPLADEYDVGEDRTIHIGSRSKIQPLAGSPNARDGARTTWQGFDETHRLNLPRLVTAYGTMSANLPKRMAADAWSMETTTAFEPGEGSVAELSHEYAEQVADGRAVQPRLFYFHRQADDDADLTTPEGVRTAVLQASGPAAAWSNVDGIVGQWFDPRTDPAYWRRVWLNQIIRGGSSAYDFERWRELARPELVVPDREPIVLTFDGSKTRDSTVLTGMTMHGGHLFEVGAWERPGGLRDGDRWEVPTDEVRATLAAAMERWEVVKLRADPYWWETVVSDWQRSYGDEVVEAWPTNVHRKMAAACRAFSEALRAGDFTHDGAAVTSRHVGNARKAKLPTVDDDGEQLWVITKDRPMSERKIDGAITATLAVALRLELLAGGWSGQPSPGFAVVLGR